MFGIPHPWPQERSEAIKAAELVAWEKEMVESTLQEEIECVIEEKEEAEIQRDQAVRAINCSMAPPCSTFRSAYMSHTPVTLEIPDFRNEFWTRRWLWPKPYERSCQLPCARTMGSRVSWKKWMPG